MLIVKLAILERVFCPQKMVASTAFATRSGGSVCPEIPWSVCPETVGQLAPKWCGLIHHNLHLEAALHCFDEGNYNVVVFLLHQSAESVLNVIIRVNLGYRLAVHNLSRMLRLTLLFTDDLRDVFDLTAMEDVQLFTLLQTAYSAARYKEDFNPDDESVKALSDKVCKLFIITEALYEQALNSFKD